MAAVLENRFWRIFFSAVLALSVLGIFLLYREDVFEAFKDLSMGWVWMGLICFFINYFFRAVRIYVLTYKVVSVMPTGIYCSSMHGFATYILPVRTGEILLPFLLKTTAKIEIKDGFKLLYKARLLDIFILGIWLIVASILPESNLTITNKVIIALLGFVMMVSPMILKKVSKRIIVHFESIRKIAVAAAENSEFKKSEICITFAIWMASATMLWCLTAAMNLRLSIAELLFLIGIQLVMQLLPFQGFANSGNHESGWVAAMLLIGYPADISLKFALTSHAITLIYILFIGLLALILRHIVVK